jgi:hypothetical protein
MKKKATFATGAPPAAVLEWIRAPTEWPRESRNGS